MTFLTEEHRDGYRAFFIGLLYGPSKEWPLERHWHVRISFNLRTWIISLNPSRREIERSHKLWT